MSRTVSLVIGSLQSMAGGTEQHLLALVGGLPSRGFEVDVSCVSGSRLVSSGKLPFPVRVLASGRQVLWRPESVAALAGTWRRHPPAACVAFFDDAQFACVAASLLSRGVPVLAARRNLGARRSGPALLEVRLLDRFVTRFLCNAEAVRRDLAAREGISAGRAVVLYNGVDTVPVPPGGWREARGIPAGAVLVACVASHRKIKAVDVFVRAFARVAAMHPEAMCVLAGAGPERSVLEEVVKSLALADRVVFEGQTADVRPLLAECQVGALASRSEGFSTAVVEYMAAGLPSVVTDVGGNSEAIRDSVDGFLVPAGDEAGFAQKLSRLLEDPALRQSMGESAQARARACFDREVMLDRMAQILREVTD